MQVSADTPTKSITIAGMNFDIPQPFVEGHVCSGAEAGALNQLFAENVRNNFGGRLKKDKETLEKTNPGATLDAEAVNSAYATYIAEYEFGARRTSSASAAPTDPVEREAFNMAKDMVKAALKNQGHKIGDIPVEVVDKLTNDLLQAQPQIAVEAKRRLDAAASIGALQLDMSSVPAPAPKATEAPAATTEAATAE